MGYTTYFSGEIDIDPPLNQHEISFLTKFADTRRMKRASGPYFVDGSGFKGQNEDSDVLSFNSPPEGQPGLWCHWVPTEEGDAIGWDGGEKFYHSPEWMQYLIDHFLSPEAHAQWASDPQFKNFTFDHVLGGTITANGEDGDDHWLLVVLNNKVEVHPGRVVYDPPVSGQGA